MIVTADVGAAVAGAVVVATVGSVATDPLVVATAPASTDRVESKVAVSFVFGCWDNVNFSSSFACVVVGTTGSTTADAD